MKKIFDVLKNIFCHPPRKRYTREMTDMEKRFMQLEREVFPPRENISDDDLSMENLYQKLGILYLLPQLPPTKPLIDQVTKKLAWLWHHAEKSMIYSHGPHACSCGAGSTSNEHLLPLKTSRFMLTNSLCVHYIACHRQEIPESEWQKVIEAIQEAEYEEEPSENDLLSPMKN